MTDPSKRLIARQYKQDADGLWYELELWINSKDVFSWLGHKALKTKRNRTQLLGGALLIKANASRHKTQ